MPGKLTTVLLRIIFWSGSVGQGGNNAHTLSVPSGVQEIRAMVYWTDYEATAGIPGRALVNDLDFRVLDPSNVQWQPWVLNPTPDSASLELWAVRATDTLNNVEQVTFDESSCLVLIPY